jgi:hypothetical protein
MKRKGIPFFIFFDERRTMLESKFKTKLIKEIKQKFPGAMIFHTDPRELQGSPDLLILHEDRWAALEGKRSEDSPCQPNQPYYVDKMNAMSYASFVYPENKEEVLNELQETFRTRGRSRISESE